MRQQGAYIVDIAAQISCSERTVRRYIKYPEPPARKTRHKMVKLKPFMNYIDMRLAENDWNTELMQSADHDVSHQAMAVKTVDIEPHRVSWRLNSH